MRGGRVRGHAADRAVVVAEHAVLHALHQVIDLALLVRTTADSVPTNINIIVVYFYIIFSLAIRVTK